MRRSILLVPCIALAWLMLFPGCRTRRELPECVTVGGQEQHVQGLAVDSVRGCFYFSFTTRFVKTDFDGNNLASIDRIPGHLGAMTFNTADGRVYASLEYKDDEIGQGIARKLGIKAVSRDMAEFFVAVIDVDKVDAIGMDGVDGDVMELHRIDEACNDYLATVEVDGDTLEHRFGCSGIDGVTMAPLPGGDPDERYLYVAYGIYGDTTRVDNDHQVLLRYDVSQWESGALDKYFVHTGNTTYGVQNLAYDSADGLMYMAVYRGDKSCYPNYRMYAVDMACAAREEALEGVPYVDGPCSCLTLAASGIVDEKTGICGWDFKWGSMGMCPLGDGRCYFAENFKDSTGLQGCDARLYVWPETNETMNK